MAIKEHDSKRSTTILPPDDLEEILNLSRFLDHHDAPAALIGPDGEQTQLPLEIYRVLQRVVTAMTRKQAITVSPVDRKLTTQESADLLGISRPTLIKLIERGEINCEKPSGSRHRRIKLADVLEYQKSLNEERDQIFQDLAEDAEDADLYGIDAHLFQQAVAEARSEDTD